MTATTYPRVWTFSAIKERVRELTGMSPFYLPEARLAAEINRFYREEMIISVPNSELYKKKTLFLPPYKDSYDIDDSLFLLTEPFLLNGERICKYENKNRKVDDVVFPEKCITVSMSIAPDRGSASFSNNGEISIAPGTTYVYPVAVDHRSSDIFADDVFSITTEFVDTNEEWKPGDVALEARNINTFLDPRDGLVNYPKGYVKVFFQSQIPKEISLNVSFMTAQPTNSSGRFIILRRKSFSIYPILSQGSILQCFCYEKPDPLELNSDVIENEDMASLIIVGTSMSLLQPYELEYQRAAGIMKRSIELSKSFDSLVTNLERIKN